MPTTVADLFAAVDVTGIQSNIGTLLLAFIGISTLFLGARYVRKTMSQGR